MARITPFEVGYCTHPACMALKGAGLQNRCFPSRAYLIETRMGLHLWDTGYSNHFMDAARGIYKLYPLITPIHLAERETLKDQLKRTGITPEDITSIIVSHFHADHVAGLRDFPGVPIRCAIEGWQSIQRLTGLRALRKAFLPDLIPSDILTRVRFVHELKDKKLPSELLPFEQGWDLTDEDEVYLVSLPGHAIGHLGAFVREGDDWTLLASDAAWSTENYTELRGPSELSFIIQENRSSYYQTLRKLQRLHINNVVDIQLTHQLTKVVSL